MQKLVLTICLGMGLCACSAAPPEPPTELTVSAALGELQPGNRMCVYGDGPEARFSASSRLLLALAQGQEDNVGGWEMKTNDRYSASVARVHSGYSAARDDVTFTQERIAGRSLTCASLKE